MRKVNLVKAITFASVLALGCQKGGQEQANESEEPVGGTVVAAGTAQPGSQTMGGGGGGATVLPADFDVNATDQSSFTVEGQVPGGSIAPGSNPGFGLAGPSGVRFYQYQNGLQTTPTTMAIPDESGNFRASLKVGQPYMAEFSAAGRTMRAFLPTLKPDAMSSGQSVYLQIDDISTQAADLVMRAQVQEGADALLTNGAGDLTEAYRMAVALEKIKSVNPELAGDSTISILVDALVEKWLEGQREFENADKVDSLTDKMLALYKPLGGGEDSTVGKWEKHLGKMDLQGLLANKTKNKGPAPKAELADDGEEAGEPEKLALGKLTSFPLQASVMLNLDDQPYFGDVALAAGDKVKVDCSDTVATDDAGVVALALDPNSPYTVVACANGKPASTPEFFTTLAADPAVLAADKTEGGTEISLFVGDNPEDTAYAITADVGGETKYIDPDNGQISEEPVWTSPEQAGPLAVVTVGGDLNAQDEVKAINAIAQNDEGEQTSGLAQPALTLIEETDSFVDSVVNFIEELAAPEENFEELPVADKLVKLGETQSELTATLTEANAKARDLSKELAKAKKDKKKGLITKDELAAKTAEVKAAQASVKQIQKDLKKNRDVVKKNIKLAKKEQKAEVKAKKKAVAQVNKASAAVKKAESALAKANANLAKEQKKKIDLEAAQVQADLAVQAAEKGVAEAADKAALKAAKKALNKAKKSAKQAANRVKSSAKKIASLEAKAAKSAASLASKQTSLTAAQSNLEGLNTAH